VYRYTHLPFHIGFYSLRCCVAWFTVGLVWYTSSAVCHEWHVTVFNRWNT